MREVRSWAVRRTVAAGLRRAHLLGPAFKVYETALALKLPRERGRAGPDGLPIPPARLRARIRPRAVDADFFCRTGAEHAETIRSAVERNGGSFGDFRALLDFGCGCGRVTRHWRWLHGAAVHGTDISATQIEWCREHLPFATFVRNELEPPLPYGDDAFDLAYSLSVFTHLPEDLQHAWMAELRRVLRPSGFLAISTHGDAYRDRMSDDERRRYEAGEVVVLWPEGAGTGLCSVYHPETYVRDVLAAEWEVLEMIPAAASGQDLYVLRAPAAA